jgi:hypothetical protein
MPELRTDYVARENSYCPTLGSRPERVPLPGLQAHVHDGRPHASQRRAGTGLKEKAAPHSGLSDKRVSYLRSSQNVGFLFPAT